MAAGKYSFAIDSGGTFTDVLVQRPDGSCATMKLLSELVDPAWDAPSAAIRQALNQDDAQGQLCNERMAIDGSRVDCIRMGTTTATNALLERKGDNIALVVTAGFRDLLRIGNQSRPNLFDLKVEMLQSLYEHVIEVEERVLLVQPDCQLNSGHQRAQCLNGEWVEICKPVNKEHLRRDLNKVLQLGIRSLAVVLLHSYLYDQHELEVEAIALELGFEHVSLSSRAMPMIRAVPRGYTACVDAYLTPTMQRYMNKFKGAFKGLGANQLLFIQSDGGLTTADRLTACRAILSGPAGGMIAVASLRGHPAFGGAPIIGFDMGGTSTDVCRYDGHLTHQFETSIAGTVIQCPQLDIRTVAAGGGSRLHFQDGHFTVGPESVGATPGPVCYARGGQLALTDANVMLNRVQADHFPKILGPTNDQPLDVQAVKLAFQQLTNRINRYTTDLDPSSRQRSIEDVAFGFVQVANEAMCRPIRALTQEMGFDAAHHVLVCYGGAAGQHACSVAKALNIRSVFVHKYASIFSAYGLALADLVVEIQSPCHLTYTSENMPYFETELARLRSVSCGQLQGQGVQEDRIDYEPYMSMRYVGTDYALTCTAANDRIEDFMEDFLENHQREFGFLCSDRDVEVENIRIRAIGRSPLKLDSRASQDQLLSQKAPSTAPMDTVQCYFQDGYRSTALYKLSTLEPGSTFAGPAILLDYGTSILIEPDCLAQITSQGNLFITIGKADRQEEVDTMDPMKLSIFSNRFISIAEQMGKVLRKTAISTNIKERLDFSCALFGDDGALVANAPHIPVHLGAMAETVKYQIAQHAAAIRPGAVLLTNHPSAGGSHLPDLTVITPVFREGTDRPVFFVANRGHHADIGGLVPGSMPPQSVSLCQEGATFSSFPLIRDGRFAETELIDKLKEPGKVAGYAPCRRIEDCVADLKAQVAANQKGVALVNELIDAYGLKQVQDYMKYVRANAEHTVREMLKAMRCRVRQPLSAVDYMDDGTAIQLKISIDDQGTALFDFTGTGPEVLGNLNTPKAVTMSAILYCIRCLVNRDIPLNDGCLSPIQVLIPDRSILRAHPSAAVVGANVLTSQRLVDVILRCFEVCAASQGCMNNVTFGSGALSYYETVAGGCGAGPTWDGTSGVQSHMTNTRITDVEILERRYPVVLQRFCLRQNSGGRGLHPGGEGVIRQLLFRQPLTLSVLTERRVFAPYGLNGGEPGGRGLNLLKMADNGRLVNIGAKRSLQVQAGDILTMLTPGGGGWGTPPERFKIATATDLNTVGLDREALSTIMQS